MGHSFGKGLDSTPLLCSNATVLLRTNLSPRMPRRCAEFAQDTPFGPWKKLPGGVLIRKQLGTTAEPEESTSGPSAPC